MPALSVMQMEQAFPALVAMMRWVPSMQRASAALLAWAQLCHALGLHVEIRITGTVLAVQKTNTSLCTILLITDAALERSLLSRAASLTSPWVPISHRGTSVVLPWRQNQPQVGAFCWGFLWRAEVLLQSRPSGELRSERPGFFCLFVQKVY